MSSRRHRETSKAKVVPKPEQEWKLSKVWYGCPILAVVISVGALYNAHVGSSLAKIAGKENSTAQAKELESQRGSIISADGQILAYSEPAYEFSLTYSRLPQSPGFYLALSRATGIPETELRDPALSGSRNRTWRAFLTPEQRGEINRLKRDFKADGISMKSDFARRYPFAELFGCVIGRFDPGGNSSGMELVQDGVLSGTQVDLKGSSNVGFRLASTIENQRNNVGHSIQLTIDSSLQSVAVNELRIAVERHKAASGSAVVIDPNTGDILALANWPSYDPNGDPAAGIDLVDAYMGRYEPGSTFKLLTLAKAIDAGVAKRTDVLDVSRGVSRNGKTIFSGNHLTGSIRSHMSTEVAIAKSCNASAATWALRVGYDGMVDLLRDTNLLEAPGLGLPAETKGEFNFNEYAKELQIATLGFGQSFTASPVAMASAFSIIASGGVYRQPRLVASVDGEPVPMKEPKRVISAYAANEVLSLSESVIEGEGTGREYRLPGVRMGGKTGTAQKRGASGVVGEGGYVANFVGYLPSDKPKFVIYVMIDSPSAGEYYGGPVAGPVFLALAKAAMARFDVPAPSRTSTVASREIDRSGS